MNGLALKFHTRKKKQMNNIVPFKSNFKKAKMLDALNNKLMYFSTALLIIGSVLKSIPAVNLAVSSWIEILNAVLIVAIFVLGLIVDYIYRNAETLRRIDLVDNSFGTRLSEKKSKDYYTNDENDFGFKKIGVNNFESAFFTYSILKESINKERFKSGIISFLFFIFAICGYEKILILILQLTIPFALISRLYKTEVLYCCSKLVCDNYRSIFDKAKELSETKFHAEIVKNLLVYESNLAWSCILLDDATYHRMNETLSLEWNNIKADYDLM